MLKTNVKLTYAVGLSEELHADACFCVFCQEVAEQWGLQFMPTFMLFKNGQKVNDRNPFHYLHVDLSYRLTANFCSVTSSLNSITAIKKYCV